MEIKVESKNKNYAEILKNNYCGINSDLNMFLLYKYQYCLFNYGDNYLSSNINKFAGDSLTHFEILGRLISMLGDKPNYENLLINDFYYVTDKEQAIEVDIRLTKEKIISYTNSLNSIKDDYIKEILTSFIIEERKNLEILEILQLKYKREKLY